MCICVEKHVQIEQSIKCCSIKLHFQKKIKITGSFDLERLPERMEHVNVSKGLQGYVHSIGPRSRRLAGHRPDGWPSLDGGSV